MTEIQTMREHDKDMLIAGFKHDLKKAQDALAAKDAAHVAAHRISCDTIRHLEAEIVRLQADLKAVQSEIQAWQRAGALSSERRE